MTRLRLLGDVASCNPIGANVSVVPVASIFVVEYLRYPKDVGTAVAQWLRYCATNRKVAGSIPDGVIGIFR